MTDLLSIIEASKGRDSNGDLKCGFSISEQLLDKTDNLRILREFVLTAPELNVIFNGDYILCDFKFPHTAAVEQRVLWNSLEKFGNMQNEYLDKDDNPIFNVTAAPLEFSGRYFYTLINPIYWGRHPSTPNGPVDTIRLLFEKSAINFFESDEINEKNLDAEIEKDLNEERRLAEIEMQKEAEHEDYLNKLDKQFNEMQQHDE